MSTTSKNPARDIALIGIMVAIIEVCKVSLSFLPNIELTTFWLIIFSIYFGRKVLLVVPVFILIEGSIYGFGLWWIMYLYLWPMLVICALILNKTEASRSVISWSILAGVFGLLFGLFGAIPYIFTGSVGADLSAGLRTAFTWWIAGIPWDLVHGVSNFIIMLVLYHPITQVMKLIKK